MACCYQCNSRGQRSTTGQLVAAMPVSSQHLFAKCGLQELTSTVSINMTNYSRWGHRCLVSCVCCLSGRGLCDGPIPRPEEIYRVSVSQCNSNPLDTISGHKVRITEMERKKERKKKEKERQTERKRKKKERKRKTGRKKKKEKKEKGKTDRKKKKEEKERKKINYKVGRSNVYGQSPRKESNT